MRPKTVLIVLLALLMVAVGGLFGVVPGVVDRQMNVRLVAPPYAVSPAAESLHRRLLVADLHADPLLWGRDLNARADHGHVDVPRLIDGHVALQVFAAVTKTPKGINYERNSDSTDNITLLAVAQRWPLAAVRSIRERARFLAARLRDAEAASGGRLVIIRSRADLEALLARRAQGESLVGGMLATEGLHPLEGALANVDSLYADGYRMFGLTHFFDNAVAGSAHGIARGGLTPLGRAVIARAESLKVLIDVAHAAPRTIDDVLAVATRPVMVSHSGVQATCPGPRNLSDDQLRRIAATGGVIGIGFWEAATCGTTLSSIANAIRHAVSVVGAEHVALGSDWDGATTTPFDASGVIQVTEALLAGGMSHDDIALVMGGNVRRVLLTLLP